MGDVSRPPLRSSGLRLLLRLLSVLAALVVLSVSSRGSASVGSNAVPMCGDHNESIAAPPIFRAHDQGSIIASPCHWSGIEVGRSAPLAPERVVVQQSPERVLAFSSLSARQSPSRRLSIARAEAALERPGFVGELLRPPRR